MRALLTSIALVSVLVVGSSAFADDAAPTIAHIDEVTVWAELAPALDLHVQPPDDAAPPGPSIVPVGSVVLPGSPNLAVKLKLSASQVIGQLVYLL